MFAGGSCLCCHHLDPGVLSSLPTKVSHNFHIGQVNNSKKKLFWSRKWDPSQWDHCASKKLLSFQILFIFLVNLLSFPQNFYLLLSCATFSSTENAIECVDCVSGWTFFSLTTCVKCLKCLRGLNVCPYLTDPQCFRYCTKLVPSAKHRRPSKSRLSPYQLTKNLISTFKYI